ncbi:hypothetical protein [Nonomuraea gerenzanensis]|uniref:Lipoprotein n=1 Tax=Nonomuraea gerenzanensis TaxID=93944 RepID=A0A1M4EN52_9ACTN|nr:hypothetical protein [Nonomuraea gerenzanensis]UBU11757.1 hypothetical protein LCN96_46890 [Nonomuraea gerenzanensis]SBP00260.1 hypothetical protein BN4615_P9776 [Nonomuraea gerenzanensis]
MRRRVISALVTAPFALGLLLTGCGSGDGGGSDVASVSGTGNQAAASAKPSVNPQEQSLKFAQCMRENGIDMPDPDSSGRVMMKFDKTVPQEKVQAAQEACQQYAPSGTRQGGGDPKMAENMRKLAQCMRDNGVEAYPDPEGGMMRITPEVGEDPDFKSAQEKCQKESAEAGLGGS